MITGAPQSHNLRGYAQPSPGPLGFSIARTTLKNERSLLGASTTRSDEGAYMKAKDEPGREPANRARGGESRPEENAEPESHRVPALEPALRTELRAREQELDELRDRYLRLAAELENVKKRNAKE